MNVTLRNETDRAWLEAGARTNKRPARRDRFRAVLLALDGVEAPRIATQLHRSRRFVQDWVYRYRDGGVAALEDKPRPGKPCRLDAQEQQRFRQRILAGPVESDGVCTLRGPEARRILQAEFGKKYSIPAVYTLMHRLRLSPLRPPKRHHKNDPEAMKAWLEEAPLLSKV
jgi:transposase